MATIAEIRSRYPQYNDMSDSQLADAMHRKFYSDMPREEFDKKIGYKKPEEKKPEEAGALSDFLTETGKAFRSGFEHFTGGEKMRGEVTGPLAGPVSTLARPVGAAEMLLSPATGAVRSFGGHGLAALERLAGEYGVNPILRAAGVAPERLQHPDQGQMYEQAKADVERALMAAGPGRTGVSTFRAPLGQIGRTVESDIAAAQAARDIQAAEAAKPQPVVEAINRLSEAGIPVNIPRAEASESRLAQQAGQWGSKLPVVGAPVAKAVEAVPGELETARTTVAGQLGTGEGPAVAGQVGDDLRQAALAETQGAEQAQAQAHQTALQEWERTHRTRLSDIDARQREAEQTTQAQFGDVAPQDAGEYLINRIRQHHDSAEAQKNALYDVAGQAEGTVGADAVRNVANDVHRDLRTRGETPDPMTMPAAGGMLRELDNLARLQIPNAVRGAGLPATPGTEVAGVSIQGLEQIRKRLNFLSRGASNDADARAARTIMNAFDDWQAGAMQNNLIGGRPEALDAFLRAREANRNWRQNFGYNGRDDVDRIVNRLSTQDMTPDQAQNLLLGSKVGSGNRATLLDRLSEATGGDPTLAGAMRGAIWNRLRGGAEGATPANSERVANSIYDFVHGSGRETARRLFTDAEHGVMRGYADTLRQTTGERSAAEEIAKNTRPVEPGKIEPGPMQQLADRVLGTGRAKSEEALFNTIKSYAGPKGDIKTLTQLWRGLSDKAKGDLSSAMIRDLGVRPGTQQFSAETFGNDWRKITPEAKRLMFGDSAHRKAIDDIVTIADRHKDVFKKFGNPSGSATNLTFTGVVAALTGATTNPLLAMKLVLGGGGGYALSKILASPAGASSVSKWAKIADAAAKRPTPQGIAMLRLATRNLANTAQSLEQ
jgi:hypothetical protein